MGPSPRFVGLVSVLLLGMAHRRQIQRETSVGACRVQGSCRGMGRDKAKAEELERVQVLVQAVVLVQGLAMEE